MTFEWNNVLHLPAAALAGDRAIPKTQLVRQAGLTKTEEKKLKGVASLTHFATLQKATVRMAPVSDESYEVAAVLVLRCGLRAGAAPAEVAQLLHAAFPNPVLLLGEHEDGRVGLSASIKRKSLAERGAVVVERVANTGLFRSSEPWAAGFFEKLAFDELDQANLLAWQRDAMQRIRLAKIAPGLGLYPVCAADDVEQLFELAKRLAGADAEVAELEARRRAKDVSLAESSKLRVELRSKKKDRDALVAAIKELCHE